MVLEPMHWRYNVDLFLATCSHLDEFIYHTVSVPRKKKNWDGQSRPCVNLWVGCKIQLISTIKFKIPYDERIRFLRKEEKT